MQDKNVIRFIKDTVNTGLSTNRDAKVIYHDIVSRVTDRSQLNRCLKMYIWINQTCDEICNPQIGLNSIIGYEVCKNILDLSRVSCDINIDNDFSIDNDSDFGTDVDTLVLYVNHYPSDLSTDFDDIDSDDINFDTGFLASHIFSNLSNLDTEIDVQLSINSFSDYKICMGYLIRELRSRHHFSLYRVICGTYDALYINKSDALLQQLCLRENSFKPGLKSKVAKVYKLKELYDFYLRYKSIKAVDIDMDEFLLIQDFKKIDADPSACTNDTDRAIAMFHLIDELGLSNLIDFDNFLLSLLEKQASIRVEYVGLSYSNTLKRLVRKEGRFT